MNYRRRVLVSSLLAIGIGFLGAHSSSAERYESTNYTIDASVGNTFGGSTSSTNYKLVSSGGESIIGNGAGGSYILGAGYVAQLDKSLQLTVQPSGQVAYYPFEESAGNTVSDATSNSNDGALPNGATRGTGKVGNGLDLDFNNDQYVAVPDSSSLAPSTAMTFSAWVNQDFLEFNKTIASQWKYSVTKSASWALQTSNSDTSRLRLFFASSLTGDDGVNYADTPASSWSTGWHHVAFTYNTAGSANSDKLKIYIDGVNQTLSYTGSFGSTIQNSTAEIRIGDFQGLTERFWNGSVDEVKLFNRALTSNEIKAEYSAGVAGNGAGIAFSDDLTAGTSRNTAAEAVIQTDAPGYTLMLNQDQNLTSGGNSISAVNNGGDITTPVAWTEGTTKGLGFTLTSASATALPGKWGTNPNYAYAAVPNSSTSFYTRTGYTTGGKDTLALQYRVDITSSQPTGLYSNVVTYTGVMTP